MRQPMLRAGLADEFRLFAIAVQFLTRVPVPAWIGFQPEWLQRCVRHFPLVGTGVGAWAWLVLWLAASIWPLPVAVLLSMAATLWLTGGFHEDGWADTLDALGGAFSREKALTIMKDSRIGAYGSMGMIMMLALKAAALCALATQGLAVAGIALVWAHGVSRAAPVLLMKWLPYAGDAEHAKAKALATSISLSSAVGACLWAVLLSAACLVLAGQGDVTGVAGPPLQRGLAWAMLAVAGVALGCARWFERRLGGYTGDTLGAAQQATEVAAYLGFLAAWPPP